MLGQVPITKYRRFPINCLKGNCFIKSISLFVVGPSDTLKLHVNDKGVVQGSMFSIPNDFKFSLFYAQGEILPPGISSNEIVTYEVSGVSEAYSKYVILFICLPPLHIISRNIGC